MRGGGRDASKTSHPAASNQAEENCFGLVILRMSGRHYIGAPIAPDGIEEGAARLTASHLDRLPATPRERRHVDVRADERPVESCRELATVPFIFVGSMTADAVVDMCNGMENEITAKVQLVEQNEQRDRVGAPRDRGDQASIRTPQLVSSREARDASENRHGCSVPVALTWSSLGV